MKIFELGKVLLICLGLFFQQKKVNVKSTSSVTSKNVTQSAPDIQLPDLILDSIFAKDHNFVDKLPQQRVRTMIATGDVIPARSVN